MRNSDPKAANKSLVTRGSYKIFRILKDLDSKRPLENKFQRRVAPGVGEGGYKVQFNNNQLLQQMNSFELQNKPKDRKH